MGLKYGKLIAAMPYQDLQDAKKVLTNLLEAYLRSAAKLPNHNEYHLNESTPPAILQPVTRKHIYSKITGAIFWLQPPVTAFDQRVCKKLLGLLKHEPLDTVLLMLNTSLKIPEEGEISKIFSAWFALFPERIPTSIKSPHRLDFSWITDHFNQLSEKNLQSTSDKNLTIKLAACETLQSICKEASANKTVQILDAMLALSAPGETLPVRMKAFETMVIAVEHADQYRKNIAIDEMLHTLNSDSNLLDAFLLPLLAIAANTASADKKTVVINKLKPYLNDTETNIWNAAVDAMTLLDPSSITAEMHFSRDMAKHRFALLSHRSINCVRPSQTKETLKKCSSTPTLSFYDEKSDASENDTNYLQQIIHIRKNSLGVAAPTNRIVREVAELAKLEETGKLTSQLTDLLFGQPATSQLEYGYAAQHK